MQDGATPTALDVQEPQKPADVAPLQLPKQKEPEADGMVNKADRIIPQDEDDKPSKSKFGNTSIAKQLTAAELNARLNVDELDESKIKIKEAWQDGNDTKIKLANGDTIQFGRDSEGYASIGVPPGQPADVTTMMSMAEIARAKGWKDLTVSGSEEFRALSYFAITNAGLKMNNPPEAAVLEQYRDRFEQTLATGVDPVTAERQAQKDLAGVSDKPIAPIGTKTTKPEATAKVAEPDRKPAEPEKKPRPIAKAVVPGMR